MRKTYLMALMGSLCLWVAVPGSAMANQNVPSPTMAIDQGEMDPALLQSILLCVQAECDMDLAVLNGMYVSGEMTITATSEGYAITLQDGGLTISIIWDDF